jgi:hypothetical protein
LRSEVYEAILRDIEQAVAEGRSRRSGALRS